MPRGEGRQPRSADAYRIAGGLWASDDGGEHWQDLTLRLPPIYAVRFEGC